MPKRSVTGWRRRKPRTRTFYGYIASVVQAVVGGSVGAVELIDMLFTEAADVEFALVGHAELALDQVSGLFAQEYFHLTALGFDAGGEIHPGTEDVVDIFLNTDDRPDDRPCTKPDTAVPLKFAHFISAFQIVDKPQGDAGDIAAMNFV